MSKNPRDGDPGDPSRGYERGVNVLGFLFRFKEGFQLRRIWICPSQRSVKPRQ
jgi:hypothetical protein